MNDPNLRTKVAVAQGASRGLGLAFTAALLARPDVARVYATARDPEGSDGLRELVDRAQGRLRCLRLDLTDEASVAAAAAQVEGPVHWLLNVAGVLHAPDGMQPEKRLESLDPRWLARAFAVNATGPALVVKHLWRELKHGDRAVIANLSARVGSISDNRLGGWYAYRASKAAQNQLTRTMALELKRRAPNVVCVALHPGTVKTDLSAPFTGGTPMAKRFEPPAAARQLLGVLDGLGADDTGRFFAWDGQPIEW